MMQDMRCTRLHRASTKTQCEIKEYTHKDNPENKYNKCEANIKYVHKSTDIGYKQ